MSSSTFNLLIFSYFQICLAITYSDCKGSCKRKSETTIPPFYSDTEPFNCFFSGLRSTWYTWVRYNP